MATASTTFTATSCTNCCGIEVTCSGMECRTRGGTASLCGYSEWTGHESTPPKKYRTLSQGGNYRFVRYTDLTCSTPTGDPDTVCTWAGTCTYNSSTCALTQGGTQDCGAGPVTNCGNLGGEFSEADGNLTVTSVDKDAFVNDVCFTGGLGTGKYTEASQYAHLTVEDTEADAITRLLAGAGGTWSSWSAASSSTCLARWQNRTSGFDLIYQEAQWRVVLTGLTPSTAYSLQVKMYRRTYGVGGYTLYQTQTAMGTSDGSGNLTLSGDVPNAYGYETYASCS